MKENDERDELSKAISLKKECLHVFEDKMVSLTAHTIPGTDVHAILDAGYVLFSITHTPNKVVMLFESKDKDVDVESLLQ